jgi:hypothetical protein
MFRSVLVAQEEGFAPLAARPAPMLLTSVFADELYFFESL